MGRLGRLFKNIAEAIRYKEGSETKYAPEQFPQAIRDLHGVDVSMVTAAEGDVLNGKVYVKANGNPAVGTMVNNGAVSGKLNSFTGEYTVPSGYHNGSGIVTADNVRTGSTESADVIDKVIASPGDFFTGSLTLKGISASNLSAENVKQGVTIKVNNGVSDVLSVTGNYTSPVNIFKGDYVTNSEKTFDTANAAFGGRICRCVEVHRGVSTFNFTPQIIVATKVGQVLCNTVYQRRNPSNIWCAWLGHESNNTVTAINCGAGERQFNPDGNTLLIPVPEDGTYQVVIVGW